MPLYQYQAIDSQGKKRKGMIEASREKEAKDKLREQGLMLSALSTKVKVASRQNFSSDQLLSFTIQLSQMVSANVPLYESLVTIEEQSRTESYHRILLSLCDQIKAGNLLSESMQAFPQSFSKLYTSMIAAGESVGSLDVVLERLSQLLARQSRLKKQIATAMIYPCILASFSFLIIIMLMGFVVPSIEGIFEDRELNGFTEFILGTSLFLRTYWWVYIPVIAATAGFLYYKFKSEKTKLFIERLLLKIPLVKTLMIQAAVARFCRTIGTLLQGGLNMIESLRIAKDVMRNRVMEEEMQRAEERIIEGNSLSQELVKSKYIPSMVSRMVAVGEEAGSMALMLTKIADIYEEEVEKTVDRLMAMSQPAILIFMGAIIGMVLLAILLPLTDVSSFNI